MTSCLICWCRAGSREVLHRRGATVKRMCEFATCSVFIWRHVCNSHYGTQIVFRFGGLFLQYHQWPLDNIVNKVRLFWFIQLQLQKSSHLVIACRNELLFLPWLGNLFLGKGRPGGVWGFLFFEASCERVGHFRHVVSTHRRAWYAAMAHKLYVRTILS